MVESNMEALNINVPNRIKEEPAPVAAKTAAPQTVDLSNLVPQTASLDQVSAKEYLQLNVFPKLEVALNTVSNRQLLSTK